jgi:hypothetical protein
LAMPERASWRCQTAVTELAMPTAHRGGDGDPHLLCGLVDPGQRARVHAGRDVHGRRCNKGVCTQISAVVDRHS